MTPTARTLAWAREQGWIAGVTERWQSSFGKAREGEKPMSGRRVDLFGFVDLVCLAPHGIIAVQCTSTPNMSARVTKIRTECSREAKAWLESGGRVLVIGWKKYAKPVNRRRWRETIRELTLADLEGSQP